MEDRYKIIGYLAGWADWSPESIDAGRLTHMNYAFAGIRNGLIHAGEPDRTGELARLKQRFPKLKTLISVGGWGAEGFSDAALTDASRSRLSESIVGFIRSRGFDGVDLDWEYPCSSDAGIRSRPEDGTNFTRLLEKLRSDLGEAGAKDGGRYLLTMAAGAAKERLDCLEMPQIARLTDFVNLMTYDFHHGNSRISGHHTNLYASVSDDGDRMSADRAVQDCIRAGLPARQIILGCAFYGRSWIVPEAANSGLYEPVEGDCDELAFTLIEERFINRRGFGRIWDATAKAPFLWDGSRFITYDDVGSIAAKTEYIKEKSLGGAMFWEFTQDRNGTLLESLHKGLKGDNYSKE